MPPVWGWILAYLLGFLLFQAILYWYLQGDGASLESGAIGYGDRDLGIHPGMEVPPESGPREDVVRCPHCGTYNDREPSYTYCRECLAEFK